MRKIKKGETYGYLTIISEPYRFNNKTMVLAQCKCGVVKEYQTQNILNGVTKSCGCYHKEILTKHGLSSTKIYNTWDDMKDRCYNNKNSQYHNYGGRGITVCNEWKNDFNSFYDWAMANGYKEEKSINGRNLLSIDRINVNGNYDPSNCRWANNQEQANNTRKNMPYEIKHKICPICGKEFIAKQRNSITCSRKCGLEHRLLLQKEQTKDKFKKTCPICGKTFEDRSGHFKDRICCSKKCSNLQKSPIWELNGKKLRVIEWAENVGMTAHCLLHRVEIGWYIKEALTIPKGEKRKTDGKL